MAGSERQAPPAEGAETEPFWGLHGERLRALVKASGQGVACSPHHLTRFSMYRRLSGSLAAHDAPSKSCLSISRSGELARVLGLNATRIVEAGYPQHSLLALDFPDAAFDFCVSDQVFEHIAGNPFDAMKESLRVVGPGGFAVHTTCFINPVHRHPGDFWRFTPEALALMCERSGGIVVSTGGWGNKEALALVQAGLNRVRIPLDATHPLHGIAVADDPQWPIVTWLVARKPA